MDRIYQVIVEDEVQIGCVHKGSPEFEAAREQMIQRETMAIECFDHNAARGTLRGSFFFSELEIARSYALLNLQSVQQRLSANMDRILDYRD